MREMRVIFVFFLLPLLLGATYATKNYHVEAPTAAIAKACAECAEESRKRLAISWLGHELEPWTERCPLRVTITQGGSGGATSFAFDRGRVLGQSMHVEGSLQRILASVIPHEVNHQIFAWFFKAPTPRALDEGAACTAEDAEELVRQDRACRDLLNRGKAMPLSRLFALREYPPGHDGLVSIYGQGHSVTAFLISLRGKSELIQFILHGTQRNWDEAVRVVYGPYFADLNDVASLERAWLNHLRATKGQTPSAAGSVPDKSAPKAVASAPVVKTWPGDPSMVRDTVAPTTGTISAQDTAAIFAALAEGQRVNAANTAKLIENDRKQDAEIAAIKGRLDRLEQWNQAPARQQAQPVRQPAYAQPTPWVPSGSMQQPQCLPGRQ